MDFGGKTIVEEVVCDEYTAAVGIERELQVKLIIKDGKVTQVLCKWFKKGKCKKGAIRRASRFSIYSVGSKSLTKAAIVQGKSAVLNLVTCSTAHSPFIIPAHIEAKLLPRGLTTPIPVMTTRRRLPFVYITICHSSYHQI